MTMQYPQQQHPQPPQNQHPTQLMQQQQQQQQHLPSGYDQVIYEALAKICEIAVRGRCTDLPSNDALPTPNNNGTNNMVTTTNNARGIRTGV